MIALGCFIAHRRVIDSKNIFEVIYSIAPSDKKHLIEINKKALREGMLLR
jgi:Pyruvate/2-oxoacid:ferredoxin oxidoreductase gamma subunit